MKTNLNINGTKRTRKEQRHQTLRRWPPGSEEWLRRQSHFLVEGMAMPKRTPDRVVPNGSPAGAAPESLEGPADVGGGATEGDNGASNRRTCRAPWLAAERTRPTFDDCRPDGVAGSALVDGTPTRTGVGASITGLPGTPDAGPDVPPPAADWADWTIVGTRYENMAVGSQERGCDCVPPRTPKITAIIQTNHVRLWLRTDRVNFSMEPTTAYEGSDGLTDTKRRGTRGRQSCLNKRCLRLTRW
jgi:hypothetical protein